jgi:hypothetical protein
VCVEALADVAIQATGCLIAPQQRGLAVKTGQIADGRIGEIEPGPDGGVAVAGGAQSHQILIGPGRVGSGIHVEEELPSVDRELAFVAGIAALNRRFGLHPRLAAVIGWLVVAEQALRLV